MHRIAFLETSRPCEVERELLREWEIRDVELVEASTDGSVKPSDDALSQVDGIIVENGVVPASVFESNPRLRAVCVVGTSSENIDVEAATASECFVCRVPRHRVANLGSHAYDEMRRLAFENCLTAIRGEVPHHAVNQFA